MSTALLLLPLPPLLGCVLLLLLGRRLPGRAVAAVGVGSVGLAALLVLLLGGGFLAAPPPGGAWVAHGWSWIATAQARFDFALRLDGLALVLAFVITFVGFWIHLFAGAYMAGDPGLARFFAWMNLFVAAMLVLVLADDLLVLYLGWEGVGLCSYLLIGFWYQDPANGYAARKAFVMTRVGDTALLVALLLLFGQFGTLRIPELTAHAVAAWPVGSELAVLTALLLLGGAVGKSAQLPLQGWLPDAMAGPTPVSALIHAATMVTAGVYLIARLHALFALAPAVQALVAVIGAATLLLAGASALVQSDIKRILAYSTMSQVGYMFLALGVGAWSAAIFHLMTHAFFKALLFLSAGVAILALRHQQDIFHMGGLCRRLPVAALGFLVGAAALAALPLVTAGFYSKDLILWHSWAGPNGGPWLWAAGWVGAVLTGLYIFRAFFIAFLGDPKGEVRPVAGMALRLPLLVLAFLSLAGGFVELPATLGGLHLFSDLLAPVLPPAATHAGLAMEALFQLLGAAAAVLGIYLAYRLYLAHPAATPRLAGSRLGRFWRHGWGFDSAYERLLVRPFLGAAHRARHDGIDRIFTAVAALHRVLYRLLSRSQSGRVRWYAGALAAGSVAALALVVFG